MARKRKFGTSLFGFKKSNVNAYIERIVREFDQRLKEKDEEISSLKLEKTKLDEALESEREKIVDVKRELKLLKSQVSAVLGSYDKQIDSIIDQIQEDDITADA